MNKINCRETEYYINEFIEVVLTGDKLSMFLNHVKSCPACYEELETRYLLAEALSRVENGETIDLKREIKDKIEKAEKMLSFHRHMSNLYRSFEAISMVMVCYAVINVLGMYL